MGDDDELGECERIWRAATVRSVEERQSAKIRSYTLLNKSRAASMMLLLGDAADDDVNM